MNPKLILSLTCIALATATSAATRIDLQHQPVHYIKPYFVQQLGASTNSYALHQVKQETDSNQMLHLRLQQYYQGVPVWHATSVIHLTASNPQKGLLSQLNAKTRMNGVVYEGLESDLAATPTYALSSAQKSKALQEAQYAFEKKVGAVGLSYQKESVQTIVYVDESKKAHYAFLISFYYDDGLTGAHRPNTIVDAETLQVYRTWDAVLNEGVMDSIHVLAGGIGGNEKSGELIYDGAEGHLPAIHVKKFDFDMDYGGATLLLTYCLLANEDITIYDMSYARTVMSLCRENDAHQYVYWLSKDNGGTRWKEDSVNGGYSPSLDAFYGANIVKDFYQNWYGVPALVKDDGETPMPLVMRVHYGRNFDNAFWDGEQMTFGDGGAVFYPLTSLGITAHEISHGFTEQHANLDPSEPQMAALHEAFSDEAAVAMQYYATGRHTWDIGREVMKNEGALRYLDNPTKDGRSIDHMKDFDATEPHSGAGIFNKAFYLIATSKGWDIHQAFNVMVKANMHYWTSSMTTLAEAACGVTSATRDYGYNTSDVRVAFAKVGIDTAGCDIPI